MLSKGGRKLALCSIFKYNNNNQNEKINNQHKLFLLKTLRLPYQQKHSTRLSVAQTKIGGCCSAKSSPRIQQRKKVKSLSEEKPYWEMGAKTTDEGLVEIRYDQYLFQIRVISQSEIGLDVIDTKTFQTYTLESHHFATQVNSSTLIAALNRKEADYLKVTIAHGMTSEKEPFLKVVLKITYDFIPHFDEPLILPLKRGVTEKDMIQTQLKLINSEIITLSEQLEGHSKTVGNKYTTTVGSGVYNGAAHSIAQLEVPKGKYEITLSFYTQSSQNWIYLKLVNSSTGACCMKLPEGGYYFTVANGNSYQPHIIRSIVDITADKATFSLDSQACNSYPWNMKNLVLSATQIQ